MNIIPKFIESFEALGWDPEDDIQIEIGGTSIYEIEGAGTKWAPVKGTRKYNKDAFIVIKNRSRNPTIPSVNDDPERRSHHCKQDSEQDAGCDSQVESSEQQSDSGEPVNEHSGAS